MHESHPVTSAIINEIVDAVSSSSYSGDDSGGHVDSPDIIKLVDSTEVLGVDDSAVGLGVESIALVISSLGISSAGELIEDHDDEVAAVEKSEMAVVNSLVVAASEDEALGGRSEVLEDVSEEVEVVGISAAAGQGHEHDEDIYEGIMLIPLGSVVNHGQFVCQVCGYTAACKRNLDKHFTSLHSEKNVVCLRSFCKKVFPTKFMMKKHLAECYIACAWNNCSKKFKYEKLYDRHQKAHTTYLKRLT